MGLSNSFNTLKRGLAMLATALDEGGSGCLGRQPRSSGAAAAGGLDARPRGDEVSLGFSDPERRPITNLAPLRRKGLVAPPREAKKGLNTSSGEAADRVTDDLGWAAVRAAVHEAVSQECNKSGGGGTGDKDGRRGGNWGAGASDALFRSAVRAQNKNIAGWVAASCPLTVSLAVFVWQLGAWCPSPRGCKNARGCARWAVATHAARSSSSPKRTGEGASRNKLFAQIVADESREPMSGIPIKFPHERSARKAAIHQLLCRFAAAVT